MVEHTTKREQTKPWTLNNEKNVDPLQRQKRKKNGREREREREREGGGMKGENKIKLESEEDTLLQSPFSRQAEFLSIGIIGTNPLIAIPYKKIESA